MAPKLDLPFDEQFLRRIRRLRFLRGRRIRHGWEETGRGTRAGGFLEFHDHRRYSPGDDPRSIDWNVFARSGCPFVKQYRREAEDSVGLVLDASGSMRAGDPSKFDFARQLAAALSVVALSAGSRVRVGKLSEGACRWSAAFQRAGSLGDILENLGEAVPGGICRLGEGLAAAARAFREPSLWVLFSDFLERPDARREIAALKASGNDLVLFHLLTPEELSPPQAGRLRVRDSETGMIRSVVFDEGERRRYRRGLDDLLTGWKRFATGHAIDYLFVPTSTNLVRFVLEGLRERRLLR